MRRRKNRKHRLDVDFTPLIIMSVVIFVYFMHGISADRIRHSHELDQQVYGAVK